MLIESEELKKRLNDKEFVEKIWKDGSPALYSQGYSSAIIHVLAVISDVEYFTEHGHDRPDIDLPELDDETTTALRTVMEKLQDAVDPSRISGRDAYYLKRFGMTLSAMKRVMQNARDEIEGIYSDVNEALEGDISEQMKEDLDMGKDEELFQYQDSDFVLFKHIISRNTMHAGGTSAWEAVADIEKEEN